MSQFLGIGSSGFFAIDHISTPKPYDICGRAQALDDLAKNESDRDLFSFGFRLDQRLQPQEPPNVKWVDWRWPRYEWEAEVSGAKVKVCRQWVVHGRAVLAQTTLQNLSETSVPDLECQYHSRMLIRDLDYVDPRHRFNEDSWEDKYYHRVQAPGGFGRITVHALSDPDTSVGTQVKTEPPIDPERGHGSEYEGSTTRRSIVDGRNTSNVSSSGTRSDRPRPGQSESLEHANEHSQDAPRSGDLETLEHTQGTATRDSGRDGERFEARDDEAKNQIPQRYDTWSLEQTNSVASVMVAYQNGLAVEMETEDTLGKSFSLGPKSSDNNVYEIVTAYKLVPLPDRELHWRNFFFTPEEVDVSEILRQETGKLWGGFEESGTGHSLSTFGLSRLNISEDAKEGEKRASGRRRYQYNQRHSGRSDPRQDEFNRRQFARCTCNSDRPKNGR